jgi:hypothetical protein
MKKLTSDEFIKRSIEKHGEKYDYSKSIYINSKDKVIICCKIHGEFKQTPNEHLSGRGCGKCGGKLKLTKKDFIEKANLVHKNKYFYDDSNYINMKTKICIKCNEHGYFWQSPDNHLRGDSRILSGNGCPKCQNKVKFLEDFIEKANLVHKKKYCYDKAEYKNNREPILILCKKHGYFKQKPINHLSGCGCQLCNSSKGEESIKNILDEKEISHKREFKFKDLKDKYPLRFDFMVSDNNNNIKYLIEFNGRQHYEYCSNFHNDLSDLKKCQIRDQMKIDYCNKNNIKLYIIKYNDDIKEFMIKIIKENNE